MQHPVRQLQPRLYKLRRVLCTGNGCVVPLQLNFWAHSRSQCHFIPPVLLMQTSPATKLPQTHEKARGWDKFWEIAAACFKCVLDCVWKRNGTTKEASSHCPPPPFSRFLDPAGNAWSRDSLVTLWLFQQMVSSGTSVSADLPPPPFFFFFFFVRKWSVPWGHHV